MNIFMQALQNKLRFNTSKGTLTTECLWDLPLTELNNLVIFLKETVEDLTHPGYLDELVTTKNKDNTIKKLRFEIAEAIIIARVAEVKERDEIANKKIQRDKLLAIITSKEAQELESNDINALKEMAEKLR